MTNKKLKEWEYKQRFLYTKGKLETWKIEKLNDCQFNWRAHTSWRNKECLSFEEAKRTVKELGIPSGNQYLKYIKLYQPVFLPYDAPSYYKDHWKGWDDFVGKKKKISLEQLTKIVRSLKLKTSGDYIKHWKKNWRGTIIPLNPDRDYKKQGWIDWQNFLSGVPKCSYRSFKIAREFIRSLHLTSIRDWIEYTKKENFPKDIPKSPESVYREEWMGMPDWLGNGNGKNGRPLNT